MFERCIGKCQYRKEGKFIRVLPFFVYEEGGWKPIPAQDRWQIFPGQGTIFCLLDLHRNLVVDQFTYFAFEIEENPREESPDRDKYIVTKESILSPLLLLIDLSSYSPEEIRQLLFGKGIRYDCFGSRVFIKISNNEGVVVQLSEDGEGNHKCLVYDNYQIKTYFDSICIDGKEFILEQDLQIKNEAPLLNWCSDEQFILEIIKCLGKKFDHPEKTRKEMQQFKSYIRSTLDKESDHILLGEQVVERLEHMLGILDIRLETQEALESCLVNSPKGKQLLDEAIKSHIAKLETDLRKVLDDQLDHNKSELANCVKKIEQANEMRDKLTDINNNLKKVNRDLSSNIQSEVNGFLTLLNNVSVSEYPYARRFSERLESILGMESKSFPGVMPSVIPPWSQKRLHEGERASITLSNLTERLKEERKCGIRTRMLRFLDAFTRAGELVLLLGEHACLYIQRYASCLGEDRFFFMQPDPSTIGIDDFWRVPGNQLPTAFAHAWHSSRLDPTRFNLLCLHAIDLSPWYLWIDALFMILQSPDRPQNLLVVATLSSQGKMHPESRDFFDKLASLTTPLKAQIDEGSTEFVPSTVVILEDPCVADGGELQYGECELHEKTPFYIRQLRLLNASPQVFKEVGFWPNKEPEHAELKDGLEALNSFCSQ